jgi:hypothetical protein
LKAKREEWRSIPGKISRQEKIQEDVSSYIIEHLKIPPKKKKWLREHDHYSRFVRGIIIRLNQEDSLRVGVIRILLTRLMAENKILYRHGKVSKEVKEGQDYFCRNNLASLKSMDAGKTVGRDPFLIEILDDMWVTHQLVGDVTLGEANKRYYQNFNRIVSLMEWDKYDPEWN